MVACNSIVEAVNKRLSSSSDSKSDNSSASSESSASSSDVAVPAALITARELDHHLWQLGKQDAYRKLPRHLSRNAFY